MKILEPFAQMKGYLLFWLTFSAMAATTGYAFYKSDKTALDALPMFLGIYATTSFGKVASAHWAAAKDSDADLEKVIEATKEK